MAKFIGTAGGYMKDKALDRRVDALFVYFLVLVFSALAIGWLSGYMWANRSLWSVALLITAIGAIALGLKRLDRQFDKQLRESRKEEKGADGERDFVKYLKDLPDTYTVVCDLPFADSYGNIDHLIIGPTGVFAIDVKDWTGTVASDGKGELLWNGRPTSKPEIKRSIRRTMEFKNRIKALTNLDPYIQGVFAFLHTHVEARWGSTSAVLCMRADQVANHISTKRPQDLLPPADIARLVSAAKSLKENAVSAA